MGKIKCICKIKDDFGKALSMALAGSLHFSLIAGDMENLEESDEVISFIDEGEEQEKRIKQVIFTGDNALPSYTEGNLRVYRYTPFSELIKLLLNYFDSNHRNAESLSADEKSIKVIAFTSAKGGIGTTEISRSMCKTLYRDGYKCLYINLSPVTFFVDDRYSNLKNKDLLRMIYFLRENKLDDLSIFVSESDGILEIKSGVVNGFVEEFNENTLAGLKKKAVVENYDYLILDIGNHLDKGNRHLLKSCDAEIMLLPFRRKYKESVLKALYNDRRRPMFLLNDAHNSAKGISSEEIEGSELISLMIPYCKEINTTGIDLEFGNDLRIIAEIINGEENSYGY